MKKIFLIWLLSTAVAGYSQDLPPATQQQLEDLADASEEENQEDDNFLLQLEYFKKHPLNVNTATAEELQLLKFLTDLQIANLIRYRRQLGNLVSIYELQSVPTWDLVTIGKVLPYITVTQAVSLKENFAMQFKKGEQSFLMRATRVLERSKGYDTALNTHYLGDRNHLVFRYRYQFKNLLYFGLAGDKDAGEQFFKGVQNKGFDFYSFHFFARNLGALRAIAIGDYSVNLGQGLIQWQSLGFGKTAEVMSVKRQAPALAPYRSTGEFYFNRGLAVTLQKRSLETTLFASYRKISGNMVNDTAERFTSLLTSGYHRTPSEIADRNKIALASLGASLGYQTPFLKLGVNAVAHRFDIPLEKRDEPYNHFALSGREFVNGSIDFNYTYKNIHFFGEGAVDKNFNRALVSGALISVDSKVDLSFLYRNIQKDFQSLFGNAFTENTSPVNEKGLYTGLVIRPPGGWQVNAYADLFHFPWLRYRVNAPTNGYDYLVQFSYQHNRAFDLYLRFKSRNKPVDSSGVGVIYFPTDQVKQNLRIHLSQQFSPGFSADSRVEVLWLNHQAEQGFLAFVQGNFSWKNLRTNLRLQYFETDSYNSRIYAYESDVLYGFSIPAFYEKGFRYYLNLRYRLGRRIQSWMRWAQTVYSTLHTVGSGLDAVNGNKKTEVKIQLLYLF